MWINLYIVIMLVNVLLDDVEFVVLIVEYDLVFDCMDNVVVCN